MLNLKDKKIPILATFLLSLVILKLLVENIFYFIDYTSFIENILNVTLVLLTFSTTYYIVKKSDIDLNLFNRIFKNIEYDNNISGRKFLLHVKILKYLMIIGSIIILSTPTYFNYVYIKENFLAKLYISFLAPVILIPIFYILYLFYDKSIKSGNRRFNLKFSILFGTLIFIQISNIFDNSFLNMNSFIFEFITNLGYFVVFITSLLLLNNNHWIAYLNKKIKWSFILDSFVIIICALIYISHSDTNIDWESNSISFAFEYYLYGTTYTVSLISIAVIFIFLRFIITSLIYLPSSDAFERRQNEMSSITSLNKIIAESKDINHITKTVTEIALKMTNSIFAWSEVYHDDKVEISSHHNLSVEYLDHILNDEYFNQYRINSHQLIIIDGFKKHEQIQSIPYAKSLIYIPINDSESKIGGICLINNKTYNFDEDELDIIKAFSANISIAFENARLLKESIENEKYKSELQIAKNIQQKLLPQEIIKIDDFSSHALSIPADDVGGDYYDSVILENGDVCYLIGDVSGKGIGAAIFMAQIKGMVMSLSPNCNSGKELLCKINKSLYKNIDKNMFVTISTITISNKTKLVTYCRAGHTPLAVKFNEEEINFIKPKGFGIGFVSDYLFSSNLEEVSFNLEDIDLIFAFSDGLNELRNKDNNEFGYENIRFILSNYQYKSSKEINSLFLEKAQAYSENLNQFDDLTLLTILKNRE